MTVNMMVAFAFFVGAVVGIGIVLGLLMLPIEPPKWRRG